jgi:hypothetical protein
LLRPSRRKGVRWQAQAPVVVGRVPQSEHFLGFMTWREFQREFDEQPLEAMDLDRLGRLSAFLLAASARPEEASKLEEAKRRIRDEIARRRAKSERVEEESFRRQERHRADRIHDEYVAQSGRMHVAQMERADSRFVIQGRAMWIGATIAVLSAVLAWASLWRQREEARESLQEVTKRIEALELEANQQRSPRRAEQ